MRTTPLLLYVVQFRYTHPGTIRSGDARDAQKTRNSRSFQRTDIAGELLNDRKQDAHRGHAGSGDSAADAKREKRRAVVGGVGPVKAGDFVRSASWHGLRRLLLLRNIAIVGRAFAIVVVIHELSSRAGAGARAEVVLPLEQTASDPDPTVSGRLTKAAVTSSGLREDPGSKG